MSEFSEVLRRILEAFQQGNREAYEVGIDFVACRLEDEKKLDSVELLGDASLLEIVWLLLERVSEDASGSSQHWWRRILEYLVPIDPNRVARIGVRALVARDSFLETESKSLLIEMSGQYPEADIATRFFQHPLRRIREWAFEEREDAQHEARLARQRHEELGLME